MRRHILRNKDGLHVYFALIHISKSAIAYFISINWYIDVLQEHVSLESNTTTV